jgi:hypothetical protein
MLHHLYMSPTVWSTKMMKGFPFAPPPSEKRVLIFPAQEAAEICSERYRRKSRKQGIPSARHICESNHEIAQRDPITFEPLGRHQFHWKRPNGPIVRFNIESLVNYMLKTGDFRCPESRIEFRDGDLFRLDIAAKEAGFDFDSLVGAKNNKEQFADKKFRQDALTGLERIAGEMVVEMFDLVESDKSHADRAQMRLLTVVFPQFKDLCDQLKAADAEYAKHSISQFRDFLAGPPNRRTQDNGTGLLSLCLTHIEKQHAKETKKPSSFSLYDLV